MLEAQKGKDASEGRREGGRDGTGEEDSSNKEVHEARQEERKTEGEAMKPRAAAHPEFLAAAGGGGGGEDSTCSLINCQQAFSSCSLAPSGRGILCATLQNKALVKIGVLSRDLKGLAVPAFAQCISQGEQK